ncbi:MAG: PrpR N-terminal domain-containing protein [Oscillospiraceae bacterium]|nr:PrpR N-terminal domain-containing protein [Oscillospiraceae bacterium]
MNRVKVLAVAPYESMRDVISSVAAARDDIEVTTLVGNMERGAALVQACDQSLYDVIISRGGTARRIMDVTSLPVIEIELTPGDIHSALAAVSASKRKFAVAGFPGIAEAAATLCDILSIDVQIVTIHDDAEARAVFPRLKAEGVELLLCDMVGVDAAPSVGMETVLITSGVKGVEDALNKAATYFSSFDRAKLASAVYDAELAAAEESLVVLGATGQLLFAAPEMSVSPAIRKLLYRMVPTVLADGKLNVTRPVGSKDYRVHAAAIDFKGERCVAFRYACEGSRLPVSTPGVRFYESAEKDMLRISRHYGSPGYGLLARAEKLGRSDLPVLVCGEKGTLAGSVAGYICMNGLLSERDCCVIDCAAVGAKGWNKLLGNSGLLSFRTGTTVLFDHLLELPDRDIEQLVDFLRSADLIRQLRMVFTFTTGSLPGREQAVIKLLTEKLFCVVLALPPLREKGEALREIVDNCLTYVCADMGVRRPAVEAGGTELLLRYGWPRNFPQLHRVVTELVSASDGTIITAAQIEDILAHESGQVGLGSAAAGNIDLSGTLEDISYRVVRQVLAEEDMNRTRAAKRLGISRATLWRILGREPE